MSAIEMQNRARNAKASSQVAGGCFQGLATVASERLRPRRNGGGFALGGAAGALLRAAGALPKRDREAGCRGFPAAEEKKPPKKCAACKKITTSGHQGDHGTEYEQLWYCTVCWEHWRNVGGREHLFNQQRAQSTVEQSNMQSECPLVDAKDIDPEVVPDQQPQEHLPTSEATEAPEVVVPPTLELVDTTTEFLEYCLGGPAALLENEMEHAAKEEEEHPAAPPTIVSATKGCQEFAIGRKESLGSDSDASGDGLDLEDMFDFDAFTLATLMHQGASMDELTQQLEESYAGALERRLSTGANKESLPTGFAAEDPSSNDFGRPSLEMGELTPLMTPDQVTPSVSPRGVASGRVGDCIAARAQEVLEASTQRTQDRARRSLAIQQRPSNAHRGDAAVKAMEAFGRKSLAMAMDATTEERDALTSAVSDAMRRTSRRHRRSLLKATEVIEEIAEVSNVCLDSWPEQHIDGKVEMVQQAMDEAYRRHRHSITKAVHDVVAGEAAEPANEELTSSYSALEERIRKAVAAAHARRQRQTDFIHWYHQDPCWMNQQKYGQEQYSQDWFPNAVGEVWHMQPPGIAIASKSSHWNQYSSGHRAAWGSG